jgi:hypothetical protein
MMNRAFIRREVCSENGGFEYTPAFEAYILIWGFCNPMGAAEFTLKLGFLIAPIMVQGGNLMSSIGSISI